MSILRELSWTDIDALVALDADLFGADAWPATTWWAELRERPRRAYAVLEDAGAVVAYAGVDLAGEVADVMTVGVSRHAQGRGLGGRLLAWMIATATDHGAQALLLEVREGNDAARALYARNGFEQINVRRGYYQPGGENALVLRRMLRPGDSPDGDGR